MWTSRPPEAPLDPIIRLVRATGKTTVRGWILSTEIQGTTTHYYRGRTRPCTHPECDACTAGMAPRWHGYLAIYAAVTAETQILEITSASIEYLDRYRVGRTTLRGALITASRPSKSNTGRLHLLLQPPTPTNPALPPDPNVRKVLERIWHWDGTTKARSTLRAAFDANNDAQRAKTNGLAT